VGFAGKAIGLFAPTELIGMVELAEVLQLLGQGFGRLPEHHPPSHQLTVPAWLSSENQQ
jgi:hypothetical protein